MADTNIRPPRTYQVQGWTPDRVSAAARSADSGYFEDLLGIAERVMADDRGSIALEKLGGIAALPISFSLPWLDEQPESDPVVEAVVADWWKFLDEDTEAEIIGWGVTVGWALTRHIWTIDDRTGRLVPTVENWTRYSGYDPERRAWYVKAADQNGWWNGRRHYVEPGDGEWGLWTPYGDHRPWSRAPWQALAYWWLLKAYALTDWGAHSNKHGTGILAAQSTSDGMGGDPDDRKALANKLKSLGADGAVAMPAGFKLELIESTAKTFETFKEQIAAAHAGMTVALLGANLGTEVEGGSYAAATVHEAVETRRLRRIGGSLSTYERDHILTWYAEFNFGDQSRAPYPERDTSRPKDKLQRASELQGMATAIATLANAGVSVDLEEWGAEFGVSLEQGARPFVGMTQRRPVAKMAAADPFVEGGEYADAVADDFAAQGQRRIRPDYQAIVDKVREAEDLTALRDSIVDWYRDSDDPVGMVETVEHAEILGRMAGMRAVNEEIPGG